MINYKERMADLEKLLKTKLGGEFRFVSLDLENDGTGDYIRVIVNGIEMFEEFGSWEIGSELMNKVEDIAYDNGFEWAGDDYKHGCPITGLIDVNDPDKEIG